MKGIGQYPAHDRHSINSTYILFLLNYLSRLKKDRKKRKENVKQCFYLLAATAIQLG